MDVEIREDNNETYFLFGVNLDLIKWIETKNSVVEKGLFFGEFTEKEYIIALGQRNLQAKRTECVKLVKKIWDKVLKNFPYPFQELLLSLEENQIFFSKYRDHSAHQLIVYLLGLYIYYSCDYLKDQIKNRMKKLKIDNDFEDNFIRIWAAISLIHDVGYIFESPMMDFIEGDESKGWEKICKYVNNYFKTIVSQSSVFTENDFSAHNEIIINSKLSDKLKYNILELTSYDDLNNFAEFQRGADKSEMVLLNISKLVGNFAFSSSGEIEKEIALKEYYTEITHKFCKAEFNRSPFWDHGVTSGLIYFNIWMEYSSKIQAILDNMKMLGYKKNKVFQNKLSELKNEMYDRDIAYEIASAIAMHNIDKKIWKTVTQKCHKKNFPIDNFMIYCEGSNAFPFGFLLKLADRLADWDRPFFNWYQDGNVLTDEDLSITFSDSEKCMNIYFKNDRYNLKDSEDWAELSKGNKANKKVINRLKLKDKEFYKLYDDLTRNLDTNNISNIVKLKDYEDTNPKTILKTSINIRSDKQEVKEKSKEKEEGDKSGENNGDHPIEELGKNNIYNSQEEINKIKYLFDFKDQEELKVYLCKENNYCGLQLHPLISLSEFNISKKALKNETKLYERYLTLFLLFEQYKNHLEMKSFDEVCFSRILDRVKSEIHNLFLLYTNKTHSIMSDELLKPIKEITFRRTNEDEHVRIEELLKFLMRHYYEINEYYKKNNKDRKKYRIEKFKVDQIEACIAVLNTINQSLWTIIRGRLAIFEGDSFKKVCHGTINSKNDIIKKFIGINNSFPHKIKSRLEFINIEQIKHENKIFQEL